MFRMDVLTQPDFKLFCPKASDQFFALDLFNARSHAYFKDKICQTIY